MLRKIIRSHLNTRFTKDLGYNLNLDKSKYRCFFYRLYRLSIQMITVVNPYLN